jgi:Flp pilus assembly protein TadG
MTRAHPILPYIFRHLLRQRVADRSGNAAIEFAIVAPIMMVFLVGIASYGGYFWMAHSLQQLTNDSARAAVAGLTSSERLSLAQSTFNTEIANYTTLSPALAAVNYQGTDQEFTISVSYNAASTPFWAASKLLPMPSATIVRTAAIKLGGY